MKTAAKIRKFFGKQWHFHILTLFTVVPDYVSPSVVVAHPRLAL